MADRARKGLVDTGFGFYLASGIIGAVISISQLFATDPGSAGVIGFLIVLPLSLAGLATIAGALIMTALARRPASLLALAAAAIAMLAVIILEVRPVWLYNAAPVVFSGLAIALPLLWFGWGRKREAAA